ncbi:alpha/beta hydrolase [Knoellia sinensis KCTC 19936]|uniref:Alpha/beta hydrolase n=1 Tax=Knoellia sinensis KCTC 19936 TaxID=1385520 RepID=A0A0A0J931_9MICO|nr:alpha/beta hydrolase [Knoellia sinensis KCTC 19936]
MLRGAFDGLGRVLTSPHVGAEPGTGYEPVDTFGPEGETVRGEWVVAPSAQDRDPRDGVIVWFHGGGYLLSSPGNARAVTSTLSQLAGIPVFAVDYRRAPENPYPAAFDDALAVSRWMGRAGVAMDRVVLAGDSAGAHLALSLAIHLAARGEETPAALALHSPVLDPLGSPADSRMPSARPPLLAQDPLMPPEFARRAAISFLDGIAADDPRIAVLNAPDDVIAALPPVLTMVGETELFRTDAERLRDRLTDAQVANDLHVVPGVVHSWITYGRAMPESLHAIEVTVAFTRTHLGRPHVDGPDALGAGATRSTSPTPRTLTPRSETYVSRWHNLEPVDDEFLLSAPVRIVHTLDTNASVDELWAALEADDAIVSWSPVVTGSDWPRPHGIGSVRTVTIGGIATVRERFYRWDEKERMTFGVAQTSVPGIRRMGEDYVVTETASGSRLVWTVAIEPSRLPGPATGLVVAGLRTAVGQLAAGLERRLRASERAF